MKYRKDKSAICIREFFKSPRRSKSCKCRFSSLSSDPLGERRKRSVSEDDISEVTSMQSSFLEPALHPHNREIVHGTQATPGAQAINTIDQLLDILHIQRGTDVNTIVVNHQLYRLDLPATPVQRANSAVPPTPEHFIAASTSGSLSLDLLAASPETSKRAESIVTSLSSSAIAEASAKMKEQISLLQRQVSDYESKLKTVTQEEVKRQASCTIDSGQPIISLVPHKSFDFGVTLTMSSESLRLPADQRVDLFENEKPEESSDLDSNSSFALVSTPKKKQPSLHLAFLFSGPLVTAYKDESQVKMKPMATLEYERELEDIIRDISEVNRAIKYKKSVATIDGFRKCLTDSPMALHFSGHGIMNRAFGYERANEGDFLVFEDECGKAQYVSCMQLKEIIRSYSKQPEFVFVSSCHSRLVGDVFKNAGAKHVVCVKRSEKIDDQVAAKFAKAFYMAYFTRKTTVCQAFSSARAAVAAQTSEHEEEKEEYKKFDLLIGGECPSMHTCPKTFRVIPNGLPSSLQSLPEYRDMPSKVEHFVGRKPEIYNVICLIHEARLITIKGMPGIGKTSMAKTIAHYLLERSVFENGIIFISARGLESTDALVSHLFLGCKPPKELIPTPEKPRLECVIEVLQNKHLLLIIDNAEDPLHKDRAKFQNMIQQLLDKIPKIKILVTSRTALGPLPDLTEKVFNLSPLDQRSAVILLEKRAPRLITEKEISDLLKEECYPANHSSNTQSQVLDGQKFEQHKLMQLLAGHPQAISLAAALLQTRLLKEIYQELMSSALQSNEMHSLKMSLGISIEHIKAIDRESVKFFKLMGLFPSGLAVDELLAIWGEGWNRHAQNLQDVSLLVRKESNGEIKEDRYLLLPFMSDYALNYVNEFDISDLHAKSCEFYLKKLEEAFMNESIDTNATVYKQSMIQAEPNILALLSSQHKDKAQVLEEEDMSLSASMGMCMESKEDAKSSGISLKERSSVTNQCEVGEALPNREAVDMLPSETSQLAESKLNSGVSNITASSSSKENSLSKRRNSENEEHSASLIVDFQTLELTRQHSENPARMSLGALNSCGGNALTTAGSITKKTTNKSEEREMVVEEAPQMCSGNATEVEMMPSNSKAPNIFVTPAQQLVPLKKTTMTPYGMLLTYYCANLIIMHRIDDAMRLIKSYKKTPLIKEDSLALANLYKLQGIIAHSNENGKKTKDYEKARKYYKKAKELFFKKQSYLGQAACLVALGELKRQEGSSDNAKVVFENALTLYSAIGHGFGMALTHSTLAQLKDKLNNKKLAKEHFILAQFYRSKASRKYIGGTFVPRKGDGILAYILEIPKESPEIKTSSNKFPSANIQKMQELGKIQPMAELTFKQTLAEAQQTAASAYRAKKKAKRKIASKRENSNDVVSSDSNDELSLGPMKQLHSAANAQAPNNSKILSMVNLVSTTNSLGISPLMPIANSQAMPHVQGKIFPASSRQIQKRQICETQTLTVVEEEMIEPVQTPSPGDSAGKRMKQRGKAGNQKKPGVSLFSPENTIVPSNSGSQGNTGVQDQCWRRKNLLPSQGVEELKEKKKEPLNNMFNVKETSSNPAVPPRLPGLMGSYVIQSKRGSIFSLATGRDKKGEEIGKCRKAKK